MYADTRFTAQMTSLSAISTTNVTVCSVCLGAATCVQGYVSIVEKFVHNLKFLEAFTFLFVIAYYQ